MARKRQVIENLNEYKSIKFFYFYYLWKLDRPCLKMFVMEQFELYGKHFLKAKHEHYKNHFKFGSFFQT
jgi:hypothetical protein